MYRNEGKAEGIELGRKEGIALGKAEGKAEGISLGEAKTIRAFSKTMSAEQIATALGKSVVEIEDILKG